MSCLEFARLEELDDEEAAALILVVLDVFLGGLCVCVSRCFRLMWPLVLAAGERLCSRFPALVGVVLLLHVGPPKGRTAKDGTQ